MKAIVPEDVDQAIAIGDTLRLIVDTTPALIHTGRPDGHLDYFNKGWLDFLGCLLEDVCGWRWTNFIHPDDVAGIVQKWHAALASGEPFEAEARVRRADGEYRLFLHRKVPMHDEEGKVVKWFGSSIDIDDRKRAEEVSRQREKDLQELIDAVPQHILVAAPDGRPLFVNRAALEYYGVTPGEWAATSLVECREQVVHPDEKEWVGPAYWNGIATGKLFTLEFRRRRSDGEYRWFLFRANPHRDGGGQINQWYITQTDIDDLKRAEDALRRSEAYLTEAQRLSHTGSFVYDPATKTTRYWSDEIFRIFEVNPDRGIPPYEETRRLVHPADLARTSETILNGFREKADFEVDHRILLDDGSVKHLHELWHPVLNGNGEILHYIGTVADVTQRVQAESELRRSEAYLAEAQRLSHTGSFGWNLTTGELHWSDETFNLLGYKKSLKPSLDLVFDRVHPDDLALVRDALSRASKDQVGFDFEHRVLLPSREIKHVHVIARPLKDENGNVELIGSVMDVTARQTAFQEIQTLKDELYKENIVLREEIGKTSMFEEVIGTSSALQMVLARAAKVAPTDSTVLITGETGTGKELIARAIHKRSKRADRPFVSVNCASIPSSLIMSELFGHEKGAFTGAIHRRLGRFELAEGGTLFLDEIGDLPSETQIALLRVLQEREFERVGGTEVLKANARMIAATNRDLQPAIAAGLFRSDLYYRLNVFPINLPPVRERKEDIPLLVNYFVDRLAKRAGKKIKNIRKRAMDALQEYSWPGNVRELQNVIERSLIVGETDEFSIDKSWIANEPRSPDARAALVPASSERERIEAALAQSKGRVAGKSGAAASLGVPASTLESRIRALNIDKPKFKFASI
jgi:formate hydrogenlyase transcriptional activator